MIRFLLKCKWPILKGVVVVWLIHVVYQLRAQNLTFVASMPEQAGTLTMHFPEVSGGTYQKFSAQKLSVNFTLILVQGILKNLNVGLLFHNWDNMRY